MPSLFAGFLTLWLARVASAENIPEALDADDQCAAPGCAVNALQLRAKDLVEPPGLLSLDASEEELMKWHSGYYGRVPGADISVANYKSLGDTWESVFRFLGATIPKKELRFYSKILLFARAPCSAKP